MEKDVLRKSIIERRLGFSDTDKKAAINHMLEQLQKNEHFLKATYIGLYCPTEIEIDLQSLIEYYPNKIFGYPKVVNERLIYLQYDKYTTFKKSSYGIKEPQYGWDITNKLEVCLVPSLGINKDTFRLGYGGGYFDRFFRIYNEPYKIGILYKGDVVEFTPTTKDVKLDEYLEG